MIMKLGGWCVAGGRYQIYTEKRRGFVDTSLIIAGVNMGDHGSR